MAVLLFAILPVSKRALFIPRTFYTSSSSSSSSFQPIHFQKPWFSGSVGLIKLWFVLSATSRYLILQFFSPLWFFRNIAFCNVWMKYNFPENIFGGFLQVFLPCVCDESGRPLASILTTRPPHSWMHFTSPHIYIAFSIICAYCATATCAYCALMMHSCTLLFCSCNLFFKECKTTARYISSAYECSRDN